MAITVFSDRMMRDDSSTFDAFMKAAEEAADAVPNGEMKDLDGRIRRFEERYNFSSDELRARLDRGELEETEQVCHWAMLLEQRKYLRSLLVAR